MFEDEALVDMCDRVILPRPCCYKDAENIIRPELRDVDSAATMDFQDRRNSD